MKSDEEIRAKLDELNLIKETVGESKISDNINHIMDGLLWVLELEDDIPIN